MDYTPDPLLLPPAYARPPGYPAQPGSRPDARNVLGVLSMVAPFIGLSVVGIVFGHLGLRAVKQGFANNRGTALAGTIISYVFTILVSVLVALLLLVAKAKLTFPHLEA